MGERLEKFRSQGGAKNLHEAFQFKWFVYWWMEGLPSSSFEKQVLCNETLRGFLAESTSDLSHLTIKHLQEAPGTALANLGVESLLTSSQTTTTTTQPTPLSSNFGPTPDPRGNIFASPDGNISKRQKVSFTPNLVDVKMAEEPQDGKGTLDLSELAERLKNMGFAWLIWRTQKWLLLLKCYLLI